MSSDGHGFIGVLHLSDGKCVNVSMPLGESKALLGKPMSVRTVSGAYLPFVYDSESVILVDGRRIGLGVCGSYYIYVKGR